MPDEDGGRELVVVGGGALMGTSTAGGFAPGGGKDGGLGVLAAGAAFRGTSPGMVWTFGLAAIGV